MGNLAKYEGFDLDDVDDIDQEVADSTSNEFAKLEEGKNIVRFLPSSKKGVKPVKLIHEHYLDIKKGRETKTVKFVCPRMMTKGKERCPACDMADKLKKGSSVDKDAARDFKPTMRIYANVIVRGREEQGAKILAFGKKIWDEVKKIRRDAEDGGDMFDPTTGGFDIIIEREGTGRDTKYSVRQRSERKGPRALHKDEEQAVEWIESQWPLNEYATLNEYKHNLALMNGEDPRDAARRGSQKRLADGHDDDDRESRGRRRPSRTAQDEIDDDGTTIDADYSESKGDDGDEDDIPY
jgi:hypothetical protein